MMTVEQPKRLRDLRGDRAWSIRRLAELADVSTQTIVRVEAGQPLRPSTAGKLAAALGIEPMALTEYVEQRRRDDETAGQDEA